MLARNELRKKNIITTSVKGENKRTSPSGGYSWNIKLTPGRKTIKTIQLTGHPNGTRRAVHLKAETRGWAKTRRTIPAKATTEKFLSVSIIIFAPLPRAPCTMSMIGFRVLFCLLRNHSTRWWVRRFLCSQVPGRPHHHERTNPFRPFYCGGVFAFRCCMQCPCSETDRARIDENDEPLRRGSLYVVYSSMVVDGWEFWTSARYYILQKYRWPFQERRSITKPEASAPNAVSKISQVVLELVIVLHDKHKRLVSKFRALPFASWFSCLWSGLLFRRKNQQRPTAAAQD